MSNINSINNSSSQSLSPAQIETEKAASPRQSSSNQSTTVDTFSMTDRAKQLQQVQSTVAALPVVDLERVEAIKTAITNGNYEINANRMAEKILQFEGNL